MVYCLSPVAMVGGVTIAVLHWGPQVVLKENQLLEWFEVALPLLAGVILLTASRTSRQGALPRVILATFSFIIVLREFDALIDERVFQGINGAHTYVIYTAGVACLLYCLWHWRRLWPEARAFAASRQFVFFVVGITIALGVAQALGKRGLWKILDPETASLTKDMVEESLECVGYLYFLFGAVEDLIDRRRNRSN